MGIIIKTSLRIFTVVLLGLGLAACVTHTERVFTTEASPEQALKTRVQLARGYIGEQNYI